MSAPPEPVASRRFAPSALLRASVVLHVAAAATVIARPGTWPWALGAVVANQLLITAAGLWPRSALLGPNWTHLPKAAGPAVIALTIDDGPDPEVTPAVLALLAAAGARATFFCVGERVRQYPALAREILAQGHGLENHTEHHSMRFSLFGPAAIAQEIGRAQDSIRTVTGEVAQFFRAPAGLRNPLLEPALVRANLRLVSWTRRGFDTVTTDPQRILKRLTRRLAGGDILLLHDGHAARTAGGAPVILEVLPPLLARLRERSLRPVTLREAFAGAGRA
ncbi:MAG TPA: polysaccharide deacetylase family protein [Steroidobacteraceae bacterium]